MSKYIGTPVVNVSVDTVDVTGDITTTDSTPEVIIVNNTHEDTDGGREGKVTFKGQQSGGEETTLAQIQASHDGTSDDEKGDLIFKTNDGSDNDAPTERARFDSSGNLLISGTNTTPNINSAGTTADNEMALRSDGLALFSAYKSTANDGVVMDINRTSTVGGILGFRKDGTSVGSLGTQSGTDFFVTSGSTANTGLRFQTNEIVPVTNAAANRDNAIDIGKSNIRFKDLYLGGGVFLGGTAAVNELNDAETGTWTPVFNAAGSGATYVVQTGNYTKIGRIVHASCFIQLSALGTGSGGIRVNGLPFTSMAAGGTHYDATSSVHGTSWTTQTNGVQGLLPQNATHINFYQNMCATSSGSQYTLVHTAMGTGNLLFSITYAAT